MSTGDGDGGSATFWLAVLPEVQNRRIEDVFFDVFDELEGLSDLVNAAFPQALVPRRSDSSSSSITDEKSRHVPCR